MSGYNPGIGPYNNPQITIANPLAPPGQQLTNVQTLLQANMAGVWVFKGGLLLTSGTDYTRNGAQITFTVPPIAGDVITASVFQIGLQLGGATPQRYVAPVSFPVIGAFDGVGVVYSIATGPAISGLLDGVNNLFVFQVSFQRVQIWRNGILQTFNVDVTAGQTAMVFLPGAIPQPGDIITLIGFNNC